MGKDIHMDIVNPEGKTIYSEIYEGRCSEWFENLCQKGWDDTYDHLIMNYDIPENCEHLNSFKEKDGFFDFHSIKVSDFIDWFEKYKPYVDAGWVTTYEKWKIENKGYIPEDVCHYIDGDSIPADLHFVEIINPYDNSLWLYNFIKEHNIAEDNLICYCFDW